MNSNKNSKISGHALWRFLNANSKFFPSIYTDPLLVSDSQWHLGYIGSLNFSKVQTNGSTSGIERIWQDYQGDGIAVGIWDDGVQQIHWDLNLNYDTSKQVSINGTINDGQPLADNGHGTSVAGLIAAQANGLGGVGIAYDAQLTGVRIFGGVDDINRHWSRYISTLDSLGQFDVTNHSYGGYPDFIKLSDVAKFEAASQSGRGSLGTVNVKSAGNYHVDGNGEALDASRFTITVAALTNSANANLASYSNYGAHILVSAPAASITTDLLGIGAGYDGLLSGDYTNQFGGTSAAAPVTTGVIALMLNANPTLGWRDVQTILAYSAIGVGSRYSNVNTSENSSWKWNGANNWNGGGLHFSEDYGYGMVNAFNAVRMAEVWRIFNPIAAVSANEVVAPTGTFSVNKTISDLRTLSYKFSVTSNVLLEHVALTVSLTHSNFTDLRIRLISPNGTVMTLYDGSTGDDRSSDGTFTYTFGADGYRGEFSAGLWTLQVQDAVSRNSGKLKSMAFSGYGSTTSSNDVYHYTSEILSAVNASGRSSTILLIDSDGGIDWIDAATVSNDILLDLESGMSSTAGGVLFLKIAPGTLIENAVGGDGNDQLKGNAADNLIYGMRGDDLLWGDSGYDIAGFAGAFSEYLISADDGVTTVWGPDGRDILIGFERLRFNDFEMDDPSVGVMPIDNISPVLVQATPSDNSIGISVGVNFILKFNESVLPGTGLISIYNSSGLLHQALEVGFLNYSNSTVTFNPRIDLDYDDFYYILIDNGAFLDSAGNAFIGIDSNTALNFQTESRVNLIAGSSRNDKLNGTSAQDRISGLGGNDVLNGKLGFDVLSGGAGRDYFVFDTMLGANNIDTITDFNSRDDIIRLENSIFSKLTKLGVLGNGFFVANSGGTPKDANDYILFDTLSGQLLYDPDGSGVSQSVQFASLVGWSGTLTGSDFVVI